MIGDKFTNILFEKFLIAKREWLESSYLIKSTPLIFGEGSQFQDLPSQPLFRSNFKGLYNQKTLFKVQQKNDSKIIPYYFGTKYNVA